MALKPDRKYTDGTEISYFMNQTATRGIAVVHVSSGSGVALDDSGNVVGTGAGNCAGILLNDVVNLDLTRQHLNQHKDETQIGGKVTVLSRGRVVTNSIGSGEVPIVGSGVGFNTGDGTLTVTLPAERTVGYWRSIVDSDGYAAVDVDIA